MVKNTAAAEVAAEKSAAEDPSPKNWGVKCHKVLIEKRNHIYFDLKILIR
jgi:hypothetical protein